MFFKDCQTCSMLDWCLRSGYYTGLTKCQFHDKALILSGYSITMLDNARQNPTAHRAILLYD
jgi:hypothetical protein